ncbi:hypothetical protein [Nocardia sp. NBC_01009]|nr:hypothetical protein OHA42_38110 [Nocardia sp. NBC_01009]
MPPKRTNDNTAHELSQTTSTSNSMSIEFYDNLALLGKVFVTN